MKLKEVTLALAEAKKNGNVTMTDLIADDLICELSRELKTRRIEENYEIHPANIKAFFALNRTDDGKRRLV